MDGFSIREAETRDAPGMAKIHVDSWRATYRGIVPDAFLEAMSYEESGRRWREWLEAPAGDRIFYYVAETRPGVVGFASGGPRREESYPEYESELYTIYLSEMAQRMGIGRGLLGAVAGGLSSFGHCSMLAWVMSENHPARGFYEAAGGTLLGENTFEVEGVEIEEVAYGWTDLSALVRSEEEA